MNKEELLNWLQNHKWDGNGKGMKFSEVENEVKEKGVAIMNMRYALHPEDDFNSEDTIVVLDSHLPNLNLAQVEMQSHMGRNVEGITRVTGFFSKVSGWNKGKKAELKDRSRVDFGSSPSILKPADEKNS